MQAPSSPAVISFRSPKTRFTHPPFRKSSLASRGSTLLRFLERVPPVESNMDEFHSSGDRIGWSGALEIVKVSVQVSVKSARGQFGCLDLRSGLVPSLFRFYRRGKCR